MILPREYYPKYISDRLVILAAIVKARSRANDTAANNALEPIIAFPFNALFGWNLKNLNRTKSNYPVVDLADEKRRFAVQVTNQEKGEEIAAAR